MAKGYGEAEAHRLAAELLHLAPSEPLRTSYRELYESELKRANALLARVIKLNEQAKELKEQLATNNSLLREALVLLEAYEESK